MRSQFALFMLALVAIPGFGQLHNPKPSSINAFSITQDIQLGREAAAQIEKKAQVIDNPELTAYVNRVGRSLIAQPQAQSDVFKYYFKVVADPSINAFSLPGGPMYVNTGLLKAVENEAQLAGVLAHEISHVALRHGTHQQTEAAGARLPIILAQAVFGSSSILGKLATLGFGLAGNGVLMTFSRGAEKEADLLGTQMMAGAGYNPIELARFFEKLTSAKRPPELLSDHPNPEHRMQYIEQEVRYLPQRNYRNDMTGQLPRMQQVVASLPPGQSRQQLTGAGAAPQTPAPSPEPAQPTGSNGEYRTKTFSLQYPASWQVLGGQNGPSATLAPREGIVQDSRGMTQIGYGAMVDYYVPQSNGVELQRDTKQLLGKLIASNPSMEVGREGSRPIRVGGIDGLQTVMYSDSPYRGHSEADIVVTVPRPEGLFYVVLIAPENDFAKVQGVFQEILRSVRFQ